MSDETAGRRLSPYYPPSDRARIYTVLSAYLEAGFDQVYINQIGSDWAGFLQYFNRELRPRLSL